MSKILLRFKRRSGVSKLLTVPETIFFLNQFNGLPGKYLVLEIVVIIIKLDLARHNPKFGIHHF